MREIEAAQERQLLRASASSRTSDAILYLARASFVTGSVLDVDGGGRRATRSKSASESDAPHLLIWLPSPTNTEGRPVPTTPEGQLTVEPTTVIGEPFTRTLCQP